MLSEHEERTLSVPIGRWKVFQKYSRFVVYELHFFYNLYRIKFNF